MGPPGASLQRLKGKCLRRTAGAPLSALPLHTEPPPRLRAREERLPPPVSHPPNSERSLPTVPATRPARARARASAPARAHCPRAPGPLLTSCRARKNCPARLPQRRGGGIAHARLQPRPLRVPGSGESVRGRRPGAGGEGASAKCPHAGQPHGQNRGPAPRKRPCRYFALSQKNSHCPRQTPESPLSRGQSAEPV